MTQNLYYCLPISGYYRCPQEYLDFCVAAPLQEARGDFRFGPDLACYGQTSGYASPTLNGPLVDASAQVRRLGPTSCVPFDPAPLGADQPLDRDGAQACCGPGR